MYTVNTEPVWDDEEQTQVGQTHFKTPLRGYTYTGRIMIYIISSKKGIKTITSFVQSSFTYLWLLATRVCRESRVVDIVGIVSETKLIFSGMCWS